MKDKIIVLLSMSVVAVGCVTSDIECYTVNEMKSKTVAQVFVASNGIKLPYRMYISSYDHKSPLVVFLHGAGERGIDNEKQLSYGISHIAKFVDDYAEDAVIIAPQCPLDLYWKSESVMVALHELVENTIINKYVDCNKVYVTGFSMGGEGTWIFGLKNPYLVTTLVPLCGGPLASTQYDFSTVPFELKNKNIWAFNYFDDSVVDNTYSKYIMSQVWSMNTNSMHYTEVMSGGHTAEMYKNKLLLQWMFGTKDNK